MKTFLFFFILSVAIFSLLNYADIKTKQAQSMNDCIKSVALEQGYKGNPASKQAWDLFGNQCN